MHRENGGWNMPGLNIATILSYVLAVAVGVLIYFVYAKLNISKANVSAQKIIDDATSKADNLVKEAILDAKTQAYELKLEAEKEIKEQKQEITELENNLSEREKGIERRDIAVQGKEDVLEQRIKQLDIKEAGIDKLEAELKDKIENLGAQFKQYHSITDYHGMMFDLGIIPKRLRSASDRSKFYKLIEASLYGGISSAITRSLRDYLLPENLGVRKAFQDMESALRENRMTLEAIKVTQSDRDLFKHLIIETTNYVASDYMRNANERRGNIEAALGFRRDWYKAKAEQALSQHRLIDLSREAAELAENERTLEVDHQSAADHLNLVLNALRHQEKVSRYQEDVAELTEKLEEQKKKLLKKYLDGVISETMFDNFMNNIKADLVKFKKEIEDLEKLQLNKVKRENNAEILKEYLTLLKTTNDRHELKKILKVLIKEVRMMNNFRPIIITNIF